MDDATAPPGGWWTRLMSGADNRTPAIGRVLGAVLFVNLLCMLPAVIVGVLLMQKAVWETWRSLLMALTGYAPSMVGSIALLIRVTNATEPRVDEPRIGQP